MAKWRQKPMDGLLYITDKYTQLCFSWINKVHTKENQCLTKVTR